MSSSLEFDPLLCQLSAGVASVLAHDCAETARQTEARLPLSAGEERYLSRTVDLFSSPSDFPSQDPLRFAMNPPAPNYSAEKPGPGRKDDSAKSPTYLLPFKALTILPSIREEGLASTLDDCYDSTLDCLISFLAYAQVDSLARSAAWCLRMMDPTCPHDLPGASLEAVTSVLHFGARKYGEHNWQNVDSGVKRYTSAALRHLFAWSGGEAMDPESGLPHLAHAACSLLFALHLVQGKIK